ncbi:LADA_0E02982g1_1 [Lachancea dasiensis]|uniref:LADA_0E02982g1_1 n=1 Tax=Lachancea dasiensis TaxID=1072105 RepID=A0A1G4JB23_9SACH|nr:LADA_0E02982g1_1 [Lachancea dasiensis]
MSSQQLPSQELNKAKPAHSNSVPDLKGPASAVLQPATNKVEAPSNQKASQDIADLMGFSGFESTKNKKVQPKNSGGKRVVKKANKGAKYRQYVNRKDKKLIQ